VGTIVIMMSSVQELLLEEEEDRETRKKFKPKSHSNSPRKRSSFENGSERPSNYLTTTTNNNNSVKVHQAGGHFGVIARFKPGLIRKMTDLAESNFYVQLQDCKRIPDHIKSFFPKLEHIENNNTGFGFGLVKHYSIIMEDLTYGYIKPCVMDIKMGNRTYAEDSNLVKKKIRQIKDSDTTSSRYGLRITGYRSFILKTGQFIECSKEAAEKITSLELFEKTLLQFFDNGAELRSDIIKFYIEKLSILLKWMETQTVYRFYSSSLLFIYDGAYSNELKADVRMIDFAHVSEIRDSGNDTGYIMGLKKLLDCFKKLKCPPLDN